MNLSNFKRASNKIQSQYELACPVAHYAQSYDDKLIIVDNLADFPECQYKLDCQSVEHFQTANYKAIVQSGVNMLATISLFVILSGIVGYIALQF